MLTRASAPPPALSAQPIGGPDAALAEQLGQPFARAPVTLLDDFAAAIGALAADKPAPARAPCVPCASASDRAATREGYFAQADRLVAFLVGHADAIQLTGPQRCPLPAAFEELRWFALPQDGLHLLGQLRAGAAVLTHQKRFTTPFGLPPQGSLEEDVRMGY
ncbi:hypothetical protein PAPYR_6161 [Paratrimastix pyriformis]|uniref:Uncharacterized protein n=1 Tax=Paratrimastix pyriformis TaxID=342808 RepID=A0ABQ8UHC3_9EUKA|nr:hypothetical protein PAPYR_6161 [Paratrimastix pyriformis]